MYLARFHRKKLAHLPTPLERLDRLTKELGGPEIWIKRDDCTGLSTGGNKTRKLEFLMGEAEQQGADVIMTLGAVQSNHARQTAAFAAKLGLGCHLVLGNPSGTIEPNYFNNGNVLLDHIHGARTDFVTGSDMPAAMEAIAERYRAEGKTVYTMPAGGSTATGSLGYVDCAIELISQVNGSGTRIDRIVHATGSAGTQAGLVAGLRGMNANIPVLGISVRQDKTEQEEKVFELARATCEKLGCPGAIQRSEIVVDSGYVGAGYGIPTEAGLEAIRMFGELESILLDPVYSAKGAAGLIDMIRKGKFKKGERVVFLHTGGSAALFGYDTAFEFDHLSSDC